MNVKRHVVNNNGLIRRSECISCDTAWYIPTTPVLSRYPGTDSMFVYLKRCMSILYRNSNIRSDEIHRESNQSLMNEDITSLRNAGKDYG